MKSKSVNGRVLLFLALTFDWFLIVVLGIPLIFLNRIEHAVSRFIERLEGDE